MRVTFLGTGTSVGVPRIGCHCAVCRSLDPRNHRLRCSILMEEAGTQVLVDTTPDLRTQALRSGVEHVDAILFTHGHADHLHGLDDVRCFCLGRDAPLPCYADERTMARIRHVFDYAFDTGHESSVPRLSLHRIDGPFALGPLSVEPIPVCHGSLPVLGFRVGALPQTGSADRSRGARLDPTPRGRSLCVSGQQPAAAGQGAAQAVPAVGASASGDTPRVGGFAYVTDCSRVPPDSMERLRGLAILVLDALRPRRHPTHLSLEQALGVVRELAPAQAYLTHMAHDLEHAATDERLPPGVRLAYDGLVVPVP